MYTKTSQVIFILMAWTRMPFLVSRNDCINWTTFDRYRLTVRSASVISTSPRTNYPISLNHIPAVKLFEPYFPSLTTCKHTLEPRSLVNIFKRSMQYLKQQCFFIYLYEFIIRIYNTSVIAIYCYKRVSWTNVCTLTGI